MKTKAFGPENLQLPVIGQGTWNMESDDRAQAIRALRRGIELGMTHIDTAELYGHGHVEELVAEAIRGLRDRVFLVSKVMPSNASFDGTMRACAASLKRLKTDHLDVYLLHWPGQHPLEETIHAFEELVAKGMIRAYGVSNFDVDDMERAVRIAGEHRIVCNQVLYHLEEREIEWSLAPWCLEHDVSIVAYSPFGSAEKPWRRAAGKRVLEEIAKAHGATAHAVALAFLAQEPGLFVIPKAAKPEHVEANAKAGDLQLTRAELERIDAAFPREPEKSSLPTL